MKNSTSDKSSRTIQVVLAEGERPIRILLEKAVPERGRLLVALKSGVEALESPRERGTDHTVLELDIPELGRAELHRRQNDEEAGDSDVLVVTSQSDFQSIAEAIEPEAYRFLTKPLDSRQLAELVQEADSLAASGSISGVVERFRQKLEKSSFGGGPILAESPAMVKLLQLVERVANSTATVLIHGETGSGKGMVARLIHELSQRSDERFVAINCSAFQDHLLESELFGHEKGAFTGAVVAKQGLFEVADKGTLFLDEVAEMSTAMQAKLLQILDSGELRRVGGTQLRRVQTRILAASNKNLREEVKAGHFREDLLFRLNVVTLTVPALRDRSEEIPGLVEGFLVRFQTQGLDGKRFSPRAMDQLCRYAWPGNVRELANTIEGLLLLTQGEEILVEDLPQNIRLASPRAKSGDPTAPPSGASFSGVDRKASSGPPVPLTEVEKVHVARVLTYTEGKKAPAARILGIDVKTLNKKIRTYGLEI